MGTDRTLIKSLFAAPSVVERTRNSVAHRYVVAIAGPRRERHAAAVWNDGEPTDAFTLCGSWKRLERFRWTRTSNDPLETVECANCRNSLDRAGAVKRRDAQQVGTEGNHGRAG